MLTARHVIQTTLAITALAVLWCALAGCNIQPSTSPETSIPSGVQLTPEIQLDPSETATVDRLPRFMEFVSPEYPRLARQAGLTGRVWVRVLVDTLGTPHEAQTYKTSDVQSLDDSAVASANQSRFFPGQWRGEKVAVRIIYAVDFVLE